MNVFPFSFLVFFIVCRAGDGTIFDAPGLWIAIPAVQSFTVEQGFPIFCTRETVAAHSAANNQ
jgi:hypothetical protein